MKNLKIALADLRDALLDIIEEVWSRRPDWMKAMTL